MIVARVFSHGELRLRRCVCARLGSAVRELGDPVATLPVILCRVRMSSDHLPVEEPPDDEPPPQNPPDQEPPVQEPPTDDAAGGSVALPA